MIHLISHGGIVIPLQIEMSINALGKDVVLLQSALDILHDIGVAHVVRDLEDSVVGNRFWALICSANLHLSTAWNPNLQV